MHELKSDKNDLEESIKSYPNDSKFKVKLNKVNVQINKLTAKIESFKADVFRLYETFTRIELNTERLQLAKANSAKPMPD